MGAHRCQAVREVPPATPRGRRCIISRATLAVLPDGPYLGALLGPAPMIGRHWCQKAVAAFDCRRGARQGFAPVERPGVPLLQDLAGQPLREGGPVTGRWRCV